MEQQVSHRRYLSPGNRIVVNKEFIGLGHTLEAKRKERKQVQHQEKEMANKLMKMQQNEDKAIKDLEKKYEQLQNIYKIRLRKQIEMENKQKLKHQKQEEIRLLKIQWRQQRDRNAAKKKQSLETLLQNNRKSYLSEKNSKRKQQLHRHEVIKKALEQNINKTIEVRENKDKGMHKIIEFKRSKNKESINYYKTKLEEEESKKLRNLERIRSMSEKHSQKRTEFERNLRARMRLEEVIKQAHQLDLDELERLMVENRPMVKTAQEQKGQKKKTNQSRSSSKASIRDKDKNTEVSLYKTLTGYHKVNPQQPSSNTRKVILNEPLRKNYSQQRQEQRQKSVALNPKANIEDTIKVIEKIEAEQSTDMSRPGQQKSGLLNGQRKQRRDI